MLTKTFDKLKNKVWLSSPTMHGGEIAHIAEAYESNWMSTIGENIDTVEKEIARQMGCKYAVALASGTAALHLAVKLAGVKKGDKVFCSDLTFAATVNPVCYEGAEPIFIDSERESWNMDPAALEKAFEMYPNVKVVVIVHLYGTPAKMDELCAICDRHGAVIVEDSAEALGASFKGTKAGHFGKVSVASFNGNKIITGSSGGVLLTDSKEDAEAARKWSTQSKDCAPWYQHTQIGYNYRMSNVIAGVVRGQLPYLNEHIEQKKAIYERYKKGFEGLPVTMNPFDAETTVPNFWLSCMLIDEEAMCEQHRTDCEVTFMPEKGKSCPTEILQALAAINAEGRPIWKPMHMQPVFADNIFITRKGENVGADIFRRGLCLPSDNKMKRDEQDRIIETIRACFE